MTDPTPASPSPARPVDASMGDDAVRHLAELIRIDTTNPPGNETPAAEYLAGLLSDAGLAPELLGPEPRRRSVIARLSGTGEKAPLLLNAHLDVVPAEASGWTHGPFSGAIADGYLWGRGAIDMKHMAVMSTLVLARLKREGRKLARDVIFAGVADEEAGCDQGSKWLADHHPSKVRAEFAVGEVGGFTVTMGGRSIYPIQAAEKGCVWMKLRAKGTPGHGSLPRANNAVVRLSRAVAKLGDKGLPHKITPASAQYIDSLSAALPFPLSVIVKFLKSPRLAPQVLRMLPEESVAAALNAILHNTANPTMLRAGYKTNVVPGEAEAEVDGRSLPGQTSADLVAEVQACVGHDIAIEITRDMPPIETPAPSVLYDAIIATLAERHPGAIVVPSITPGFTDAKHWSRLGARCYGFCPVQFPAGGPRFADLFHGHDERIPVEGLKWGVETLYDFVRRAAG